MNKRAWKRIGTAAITALGIIGLSACKIGEDEQLSWLTKPEGYNEQQSEEAEPNDVNYSFQKPVPIKIANFLAYDHPVNVALECVLKPMLEEKTEGRYTIEVYADGDLGGEDSFLKGIKNGTIEAGIAGVELSEEYPALKVVDFPFLFEDIDSSYQALTDKQVTDFLNQSIEPAGIMCKGYILTGVRSISNNVRPITTPEDCEGLTLRTPYVTQFIEYAQRLGFRTVNSSVPEIYTVLQQKLADGQENPPTALLTSGWYEVQDYLSLTQHQITYNWLAVNKEFYNSMTAEDKQAFDECCSAFAENVKETYKRREAADIEALRKKGVEVIQVDREPFRKVGEDMIKDYCERYPEFWEMVSLLREKGAR